MSAVMVLALAGIVVLPGTASAAEPGQICQVNTNAPGPGWSVFTNDGTYYLNYPQAFHINGYAGNTYTGHGNNKPYGNILRVAIAQNTCRFP
ncbi:MAG: hypothetical protein ACJ72N_10010 [Labedaea sp.]